VVESIYGCPYFQMPSIISLLSTHNLIVGLFLFVVGFLFLFYGHLMLRIVSMLAVFMYLTIFMILTCMNIIDHEVSDMYLYLAFFVILVIAGSASYMITKYFMRLSIFLLGSSTF
jgi:hypothetical protein